MWLFILSIVTAAMLSPAVNAAACSNFSVVNNPYNNGTFYLKTMDTIRISAIVNCTGNHLGSQIPLDRSGPFCNGTQCALWNPLNYTVELYAYLNLTSASNGTIDNISQLVYNTTYGAPNYHPNHDPDLNADLNRTSVHQIPGVLSKCLNEAEQAFFGFTPFYVCVEGTLSGCSGDGAPVEGTPINVCGPRVWHDGHDFFGPYHLVQYGTGKDSSEPAPPNAIAGSTTTNGGGGAFIEVRGVIVLIWSATPLLAIMALEML